MKRQLVLIYAGVALALTACDDNATNAPKGSSDKEVSHAVDTLYLSSKDTVVIKDSVLVKDTVVRKDTVYVIDSLTKGDTSCVVTDQGVSFKIQCKDKVPYILNKATCNGKAYDPSIDLCLDSTILAIEHADTCKGVIYDSRESFCSASEKVVAKCDGKSYDADSLFCFYDEETETYSTPKRCGGHEYDINQYECEKGVVIGYCGETKYNINAVVCKDGSLKIPLIWINGQAHLTQECKYQASPITGFCLPNNNCKYFDWDECVECKDDYIGVYCEIKVTCQNGIEDIYGHGECSSCFDHFAGKNCDQCAPGYYGPNCRQAPPCIHGTVDDGLTGTGKCTCESNFTGENCDIEL